MKLIKEHTETVNYLIEEDKETGKRHKAKTPLQVYNICKKLKLFKK